MAGGGYECNLVVIAGMLAVTEAGPGRPSVDDAVFPDMRGTAWAFASLAAAAAGSALATSWFSEPEPVEAPQEGRADVPGDPALAQQPRFTREPAEAPAEAEEVRPAAP